MLLLLMDDGENARLALLEVAMVAWMRDDSAGGDNNAAVVASHATILSSCQI
jgi:hypothetical protein